MRNSSLFDTIAWLSSVHSPQRAIVEGTMVTGRAFWGQHVDQALSISEMNRNIRGQDGEL